MNISPHLCKKLNAQYEEGQKKKLQEEDASTFEHSHLTQGGSKRRERMNICPKTRLASDDQATKFRMELIQTKEDENVFSRLNPNILNVKNNIDLPEYLKHVKQQKSKSTAKKYHEMNDHEKETYNLIKNLRRELTADNLQAKLMSYIRSNHDEKMITSFCQELVQTKKAIKAHEDAHAHGGGKKGGHGHGGEKAKDGHGEEKGGHGHGPSKAEDKSKSQVGSGAAHATSSKGHGKSNS